MQNPKVILVDHNAVNVPELKVLDKSVKEVRAVSGQS